MDLKLSLEAISNRGRIFHSNNFWGRGACQKIKINFFNSSTTEQLEFNPTF